MNALLSWTRRKVAWHRAECGSYTADLPVWRRLAAAEASAGTVLDLGAGAGRVTTDLAGRGHHVVAFDRDPDLLAAARDSVPEAGSAPILRSGDVRDFDLDQRFRLILAPMQLLQLLLTESERRGLFDCCARHLDRGGTLAVAVVDPPPDPPDAATNLFGDQPLEPDSHRDGDWLALSQPLSFRLDPGVMRIERRRYLRRRGDRAEHAECASQDVLARLGRDQIEAEADRAGLELVGRSEIAETERHAGSRVMIFQRRGDSG